MFPSKFSAPKNFRTILLILPIIFSLTGCVYLVVGGAGALGGYIVSPDTVEGVTSHEKGDVWDAAIEIVSIMGWIENQNELSSVMRAKISGAKVTITISSINNSTTKVSIKSRKAFLPKISTAQDIFVKIMSRLNK